MDHMGNEHMKYLRSLYDKLQNLEALDVVIQVRLHCGGQWSDTLHVRLS